MASTHWPVWATAHWRSSELAVWISPVVSLIDTANEKICDAGTAAPLVMIVSFWLTRSTFRISPVTSLAKMNV